MCFMHCRQSTLNYSADTHASALCATYQTYSNNFPRWGLTFHFHIKCPAENSEGILETCEEKLSSPFLRFATMNLTLISQCSGKVAIHLILQAGDRGTSPASPCTACCLRLGRETQGYLPSSTSCLHEILQQETRYNQKVREPSGL